MNNQTPVSGSKPRLRAEKLLVLLLLVWAVAATSAASLLYIENLNLRRELRVREELLGNLVLVNIGIDYGNGTVAWYNNTLLPRGATVLSALVAVARVEYKFGSWGAYVTSVNGVEEKILSKNEGYSWLWYIFNREKGQLELGPVAADKYELASGDVILWRYEHWKF
uniref:DUF4430 domain-containing protein n=1 Tax=Thermofilum pendens TaxID=2269 RepID=A0A7C1PD62_THEPE